MTTTRRRTLRAVPIKYVLIVVALAAALFYGRSRSGPQIIPHVHALFPGAVSVEGSNGVYAALDRHANPLGWAGVGSASGYGGPLLLLVGIDPDGRVVGARVIEHRETPLFFQMAKASRFLAAVTGTALQEIDYDYQRVVGVTGASRSAGAITASVRDAVANVANRQFGAQLPSPRRPFEFGVLEIALLVLFAFAIASQYLNGSVRGAMRWGCQLSALLVIGFWKNSPLTIAKIVTLLAGYFPSLRSSLSFYVLVTGFAATVLVFGSSIYCSHVCPFGAVQRCIAVIGGKNTRLPPWSVRYLRSMRTIIVFLAVLAALLVSRPALASYEPFAVMFALKGGLLQWFLLLIVVLASLTIHRPWCHFFCPMRVCENALQDVRERSIHWWRSRRNE